jgi:8-oxo-dGTP diphosphatase
MTPEIEKTYGNRIRVRVCGLCWSDEKLLMINHIGLNATSFWAPPGGGIEFGSSATENLVREFREETGLIVEAGNFMFGCEFIHSPLHSVELFFKVNRIGGTLMVGTDPELPIIKEVRFMDANEIRGLEPTEVHGIFRLATTSSDFDSLRGFYTI